MQAPNRDGSSDREKELERRAESLQQQLERALAEIERLRKQLEEALRANKRSAAPFSKGEPKSNPTAGTQARFGIRAAGDTTGSQPGG